MVRDRDLLAEVDGDEDIGVEQLIFLSVDDFLNARPAMSTYTDDEVQEGINVATELLNALCNGLVEKVIEYNLVADRTKLDTSDDLYRTDFEFKQLRTAIIVQTQHNLNMGNDFTQGSSSMSSGGLNASFQRPEKRDVYAPSVKELLRAARCFVFQEFNLKLQKTGKECWDLEDYYNKETSNTRFVKNYQEKAIVGSVAVIDNNNMVSFQNPNEITFRGFQANQIKDYTDDTYKPIDRINNLAWVGNYNKNVYTIAETNDYVQKQIDAIPQMKVSEVSGGLVLTFRDDNDFQKFKKNTNTTDNDFITLYKPNDNWVYKYIQESIYKSALVKDLQIGGNIDIVNNPSIVELREKDKAIEKSISDMDTKFTDEIGKNVELINEVEMRVNEEIQATNKDITSLNNDLEQVRVGAKQDIEEVVTNLNSTQETIEKAFTINDKTTINQTTEIDKALITSDNSILNKDWFINDYFKGYKFYEKSFRITKATKDGTLTNVGDYFRIETEWYVGDDNFWKFNILSIGIGDGSWNRQIPLTLFINGGYFGFVSFFATPPQVNQQLNVHFFWKLDKFTP